MVKKVKSKQVKKATPVKVDRAALISALPALKKAWATLAEAAKMLKCTPREARRAARRAVKTKALKWAKVGAAYYVAAPACRTNPPAAVAKVRGAKKAKKAKAAKGKKSAKKAYPAKSAKKPSVKKTPVASGSGLTANTVTDDAALAVAGTQTVADSKLPDPLLG